MADTGKLEKMKIIAYRDADLNDNSKVGEYSALINPETYQLDYKIEYNDGQGQGTSGAQPKYKHTKPEEFSFEFLFDSTGIIDGTAKPDIWDDLKAFKQMLVDYDGAIHQPRHFKLVWGVSLFKCRLTSLQITFKLFKPDGTPIRAVAKTQFKGSVEENLRVAKENSKSPDLTHQRQVLAGDNLPLLCFRLYEDPRHYLSVAKANGLTNFRRLTTGQTLNFPPFRQMTTTRTLPTSAPPDVCTFKIFSEGTQVSDTVHVLSVVVAREVNRIPTATLVMIDGEAAAETFAVSDQALFVPGKKIEIKAGYRGQDETIFKGIVIRHSIKVRKDSSFLTVECKDEAVKMTVGERSHYYRDQKDSDLLEQLLGRHSLQKEVEATTTTHPQLVQYHTTDWDFMLTRADQSGLICLVQDGKVKLQKPKTSQDPVVTLQYGATLLELDAEIDARLQPPSLKAQAWDPAAQELREAEAREPSLNLNGNLSGTQLAQVLNQETHLEPQSGHLTEPVLRDLASAKLLKQRLAKIRGRARCQGLSQLLPGTVVELRGVGERFQGRAFVSGVRHQIANGNWESDVQLGLDPEWFTQSIGKTTSGQPFATIAGLHVGTVTQLENDPAGEDRIKVRLPTINTQDEGIWARVATLDAGGKRGTFFRPELQDEVVVGFFNNDPGQAVVLGMCHSSAKPAPLPAADPNHEKGYVSRSEMKVLFNDDKITVTIQTPAGNTLLLSEENKLMKLEDQHGNKLLLDQAGITLESIKDITLKATGDVKLEGVNITAKAQSSFKAEGGAGNELSAGNGMAVVKGGTVMIN